jgi:hypothetical protein
MSNEDRAMTTNRRMLTTIALAVMALAGGGPAGASVAERVGVLELAARASYFLRAADASDASLDAAEWSAIKRIIGDQLVALRSGDATRAFSYASTGIRDQFDDATTFLLMVRQRYGVLLTARYTEFLEGAVIDGHTIQPLRLVMNDDTVLVALYEMQRDERGGWRIAGCVIAPSTVRST